MKDIEIGKIHVITGDNGTGKTRFLSKIATENRTKLQFNKSKFSRLICLSGTVFEKFPRPDKTLLWNMERHYYYFGYKTNNNMFSEITPFRNIINVILHNKISQYALSCAIKSMDDIGFQPVFNTEFRWARGSKEDNSIDPIEFDLTNFSAGVDELEYIKDKIYNGDIHLSKIYFSKKNNNTEFSVTDLSSGERQFILIILALSFSISENALVLFDEPENSMHPFWQLRISQTLSDIITNFHGKTTCVVATHSPLVVSSIPNMRSKIIDFGIETNDWIKQEMAGNSFNVILKEQFNLYSSRSTEVLNAFNACLHDLANDFNKFQESREHLKSFNLVLSPEDPLFDAYNTIMECK